MGAATAHALARAGVDVAVHEQFQRGHDRGSSHGRSRIFRLAYPDADWVRLAQEAFAGWRALEAESGRQLLDLVGLVEVVDDVAESSASALDECGVGWESLTPEEAERRFPIRLPPGSTAVLQADAGVVYADRALDAEVVVVTAGAWARRLLREAAIDLDVRVTRETVCYFRLDDPRPVPSVIELRPEQHPRALYGLADPVYGLKLGCHHCGPEVDPEAGGAPEPRLVEDLVRWACEMFPAADPEPAAAETCLYTSTADESFVLERHGRIVVGSACSGHGFKFAPAIGKRLARLALEALEQVAA